MYGVRLSRELGGMKYREFSALLAGLDGKTPLGRVTAIRSENDPKRLREFTPEMRRIRSRWLTRQAARMPQKKADDAIEALRLAFVNMAGGERHG